MYTHASSTLPVNCAVICLYGDVFYMHKELMLWSGCYSLELCRGCICAGMSHAFHQRDMRERREPRAAAEPQSSVPPGIISNVSSLPPGIISSVSSLPPGIISNVFVKVC